MGGIIFDRSSLSQIEATVRFESCLRRMIGVHEDLDELRGRMLARRQQHDSQDATVNTLALVVTILSVGFISVLLWQQMSPPSFRADYAASYPRTD